MHLKRGDQVVVIAGNDKGKSGEVVRVLRAKSGKGGRVVVSGINVRTKHIKPSQQNPQGERVERELSIDSSNVMLLDPQTGKGTRKRPAKG